LNISTPSDAISERTEVLHGEQNVMRIELQFFSNSGHKIDTCMNYTRPALAITIEAVRNAFIDAKKRGVKLRYLTEITKDNISYCKDVISIVNEMRHLDGIKGNFMLSETEYIAPIILFEKGKIASQIIYSNQKEIIEQHQYMFDTLWSKAISAQQRIKGLEDGTITEEKQYYQTRLLENQGEIIKEIKRKNNAANKLSICTGFGGMQMSYNYLFDSYKNVVDKAKKQVGGEEKEEGFGLRWITDIEGGSLTLVKKFLQAGITNIRHIKNMPPLSFGVSDKEVAITIENMEGGKMSQKFLISSEPLYVDHFNSLFEELWKNSIDARERIRDIEAGVDLADIEVIPSSLRAQDLYLDIVNAASKEILWIFPTTNAFLRQDKIGAIPLAMQAARERNVKVRILVPANSLIEQKLQQLKEYCHLGTIGIRYIEQMSETKATILVVDRKDSMVMELKDDSKPTFYGAIGLSTHSNSKAGVLSYVAIFENLWKQSELYEQLMKAHEQVKIHDKMQREFINIAAHELRSPIQPILSLSEVVLNNTKDTEQAKLLEVINRNGKRLQRLTEDVLDVTKIESQSLNLKKEQFNLKDVITNAIDDIMLNNVSYKAKAKNVSNDNAIKFLYKPQDVFVYADKARIGQVIHNLLDNAVKFINYKEESTITVHTEKEQRQQLNNNDQQQIIVSIKDTGEGIDAQIFPRLFTKFATKSETGTGLGLYICKGIVEAHGGRIWAENNSNGRGATFSFSLPIDN
jgi:two-component system, OmpR family, sensor histidine kinase VicK